MKQTTEQQQSKAVISLQAENDRLNTIIDNRAEDQIVLEKYRAAKAELESKNAELQKVAGIHIKIFAEIEQLQAVLKTEEKIVE